MKKSKLKILIPLTLGILFLSLTSTVNVVADPSTVTFRPLSHWILNNPRVSYGWGGQPPTGDLPLYILMLSYPWAIPDPNTYDGYIMERTLKDGRAELTVYIEFFNAPFWLFGFLPDIGLFPLVLQQGSMINCRETTKFTLPEPGMVIPNLFEILYNFDLIMISIEGTGAGIFTTEASIIGFTPGAQCKVVVNQRGFGWMDVLPLPPPLENYMPIELINVLEIGD